MKKIKGYSMKINGIEIKYGVKNLEVDILNWHEASGMITYRIKGTPICQFDQHSRFRRGMINSFRIFSDQFGRFFY